ncbi:MAG: ribonuclease III [Firmicutes bacterium]|nr:ribonuclease III [Bacillota bacterium]
MFHDPILLETALTHSSYSKEHSGESRSNERLEFLGDAFFDAIIGEELFHMFPEKEEGWLSRIRATIVCEKSLAAQARKLDLGSFLLLGHGEEKTGGRRRESILADAAEALIGAVYLDGGYDAVKSVVLEVFRDVIDDTKRGIFVVYDYKTHLQEVLQAHGITDIRYQMTGEKGPDHDKTFTVGLYIDGALSAEGKGKSKKQAEQNAAMKALKEDWNEL